ncbi:MAG TPA: hypothetical protein VFO65_12995 [Acidimicrobiales bacterium]|nr:hypothetical protein [Acidimicrobiales bacterium]
MRARVAGVALAAVAALAPVPVAGQQAPSTPAAITREAWFKGAGGVIPATLTREFPPAVLCIVSPQLCGPSLAPLTAPLGQVLPAVEVPADAFPETVDEGTLPVGLLGGAPRYQSYLRFDLPGDIPHDAQVDRFDLVLSESGPSYALESPAFRQAVLAALVAYEEKSPEALAQAVKDAAQQTTPLVESRPTGIEACAVSGSWEAGPGQDAGQQPARDCILGANGVRDEATRTWRFDLSLLAQSWLDGSTPNEGLYLGPIGAENLAFGDPDVSTNFQISLAGAGDEALRPRVEYSFSPGFDDDFDGALEDLGDLGGAGPARSVNPFAGPSGGGLPVFDPAGGSAAPSPAVPVVRPTLVAQSRPRTPGWLWLLIPGGLAAAVLFERALRSEPELAGTGRPGALSRLMSRAAS